jgi:hypothetical protein
MFSDSEDDAVMKQFNENAKIIFPETDEVSTSSDEERAPISIVYKQPTKTIVNMALKLRHAHKVAEDWVEVIKKCPSAYGCIPNPTYMMAKLAVQGDPKVFQLVKKEHHTKELCEIAVEGDPFNITRMQQTDELVKKAIKARPLAIQWIVNQTEELCMMAIKENPLSFEFCKVKTPAMFNYVMDKVSKKQLDSMVTKKFFN